MDTVKSLKLRFDWSGLSVPGIIWGGNLSITLVFAWYFLFVLLLASWILYVGLSAGCGCDAWIGWYPPFVEPRAFDAELQEFRGKSSALIPLLFVTFVALWLALGYATFMANLARLPRSVLFMLITWAVMLVYIFAIMNSFLGNIVDLDRTITWWFIAAPIAALAGSLAYSALWFGTYDSVSRLDRRLNRLIDRVKRASTDAEEIRRTRITDALPFRSVEILADFNRNDDQLSAFVYDTATENVDRTKWGGRFSDSAGNANNFQDNETLDAAAKSGVFLSIAERLVGGRFWQVAQVASAVRLGHDAAARLEEELHFACASAVSETGESLKSLNDLYNRLDDEVAPGSSMRARNGLGLSRDTNDLMSEVIAQAGE